eukprot:PhM_4_TR1080/c0_g1_i1/m.94180/K17427/MRPL46; large subunit ribosomal protein L46
MLRRSFISRSFHSQRDIPILPQQSVYYNGKKKIHVGYLMMRPQVVRPDPHPLETEGTFMLDQEYQRYSRHEKEAPASFLKARGANLDNWNRDEGAVKKNFFNLDLYADSYRTMLSTWTPPPRVTDADFDPASPRQTLRRALSDNLFLIANPSNTTGDVASGWIVPAIPRKDGESLRMTLERCVFEHHGDGIDYSIISNAPQGVLFRGGDKDAPTYLFVITYLDGKPQTEKIGTSHAWVTRQEILEYGFVENEAKDLLYDMTIDGTGDVIEAKY